MLELFLKLIDRFIKLSETQRATDRLFFQDFIEPAMKELTTLHETYMEHLAKYRTMVGAATPPFDANHPIFAELKADSLWTQGSRHFFLNATSSMGNEDLDAFMLAAQEYFMTAVQPLDDRSATPPVRTADYAPRSMPAYISTFQTIRPELYDVMSSLNSYDEDLREREDLKRRYAMRAIIVATRTLQRRYGRLLKTYQGLKQKYLLPR